MSDSERLPVTVFVTDRENEDDSDRDSEANSDTVKLKDLEELCVMRPIRVVFLVADCETPALADAVVVLDSDSVGERLCVSVFDGVAVMS